MTINDLQDGQTVKARFGRAGEERVVWLPWREVQLTIQRKKRNNEVVIIGLKNILWAEYAPRDFSSCSQAFVTGGYYLEIEGLTRACERQPPPNV